jgi:Ca2+:H+ antiporter
MYASTPQHLIDEESHPGVLTEFLNSSSSSSDTSSSSSSDSDSSRGSTTTAKRIKRALRRKRRKSVSSSKDTALAPSLGRTGNDGTNGTHASRLETQATQTNEHRQPPIFVGETVLSGDEADVDGEGRASRRRSPRPTVTSRDFETGSVEQVILNEKPKKRSKKRKRMRRSTKHRDPEKHQVLTTDHEVQRMPPNQDQNRAHPNVAFAEISGAVAPSEAAGRPFTIKNFSEAIRPAFNSSVFPHHQAMGRPLAMPISTMHLMPNPRSPSSRGVRRTNSMPDMVHPTISHTRPVVAAHRQSSDQADSDAQVEVLTGEIVEPKQHLSGTSAVVLLLCTTGLVALCAEFLVGSIDYLIANSGVSQAFIGLIVLPIVGNAAEHVTAVTVAAKNKMDLAIGIALGSSIQIAIFVTPLMVILGWIMKTDMSLYFSLFETVSLFASAFIVSFLMIDGRSNYLEGALLIAAYIIIAVSAYFYPDCDLSSISGPGASSSCPS